MHLSVVVRFLTILSLSLWAHAAAALDCREALVGDYAVEESGAAVLRVEKVGNRLLSRQKETYGQWSAGFFESAIVPPDEVRKVMGTADPAAALCGLRLAGGLLFKLPVGHEYAASSATEKSLDTRKALSGYLYYEASGFAVSATDIYRVAPSGVSPSVPPTPPPAAVATAGHEVPTAVVCPGQRPPDMQQSAFNALPAGQKRWFERLDASGQSRFVCGQYVHDLIQHSASSSRPSVVPKEATLKDIAVLVQAGQVPRNAKGEAAWTAVSHSLLAHHVGTGGEKIPLQKEVFALFVDVLLPHIDGAPVSERDLSEQLALLKEVALMPPPFGLVALKALNRNGLLERVVGSPSERAAIQVLRFNTMRIPGETFDYLLASAGPGAANDVDVMTALIDRNGIDGMRRMLHAGANPAQRGWLARARMDPAAASGVYPLMLDAALLAAKAGPVPSRLLGDQLTVVVGKLLAQCPVEPGRWKEMEGLLEHGARLQGVFDNGEFAQTNLGVFALKCPEGFKALLERGLPLDALYPYPTYAGKRQDAPLLMYLTATMEDFPPQAQVLAEMLRRHNNANERPACAGCSPYSALEMAILLGDIDLVKVLLDFGADPNDVNRDGRPASIRAVIQNRADMLEVMHAKRKLDLHTLDKTHVSLLAWAHCAGAKNAMAWLEREGAVNTGQALCAKKG